MQIIFPISAFSFQRMYAILIVITLIHKINLSVYFIMVVRMKIIIFIIKIIMEIIIIILLCLYYY